MNMLFEPFPEGVSLEDLSKRFVRESRDHNAIRTEMLMVSSDDHIALLEAPTKIDVHQFIFPYVHIGRRDVMSKDFSAIDTMQQRAVQSSSLILPQSTVELVEALGIYRYAKKPNNQVLLQIPLVVDLIQTHQQLSDNAGIRWYDFDEAQIVLKSQAQTAPSELRSRAFRISRIMKEFNARHTV